MLKSLCRSFSFLLALSVLLPFAQDAGARTPESGTPNSRPSFKSGFSSQKPSQKPAPSYKPGSGSGSGGFGSFSGGRADSAHRSESASSRQLTRKQAEENALRTLEERRARSARAAERDERNMERNARPEPDYRAPAPSYPPARQNNGGLGNVVTGAVIAGAINEAANAANRAANHPANRQTQTAPDNAGPRNDWGLGPKEANGANGAAGAAKAGGQRDAGGASFARLFLWLCLLALIGGAVWFMVRRARRRREADKPNYSFERN